MIKTVNFSGCVSDDPIMYDQYTFSGSLMSIVGIGVFTIFFYLTIFEIFSHEKRMIRKIPGPFALPFIGSAHLVKSGGNGEFLIT